MEELKERLKKLSATQTEQSGIADQIRGIADQIAKDLTEASADLLRRKAALDKWTADYLDSSGGEPLEVILSRYTQEKTELAFRLRTQTENKAKVSGSAGRIECPAYGKRTLGEAERTGRFCRRRQVPSYSARIYARYTVELCQCATA